MISVSSQFILWKVEILNSLGANTKELLSSCNINEYEIKDGSGRIEPNKYFSFLNKTLMYDRDISIYIDKNPTFFIDSYFISLFGLCLNSPTPLDAIKNYLTYRDIMGSTDSLNVKCQDNSLLIEYKSDSRCNSKNLAAQGNFLMLHNIINSFMDNSNLHISANFVDNSSIDEDFLNSNLNTLSKYNQTKNQLIIKCKNINTKNLLFNKNLYDLQIANAQRIINKNKNISESFFARNIEKIITELIYTSKFDIEKTIFIQVCNILNLSRWTINNRLQEEQTCFSQLMKNVRLKVSCDLLLNTEKSIQEISDITHFSSLASFSRFFSTHMNQSPKKYRSTHIMQNSQLYQ